MQIENNTTPCQIDHGQLQRIFVLVLFSETKQTEPAKLIRDADIKKELSTLTKIEGKSKEERGIRKALVKEMWSGKS